MPAGTGGALARPILLPFVATPHIASVSYPIAERAPGELGRRPLTNPAASSSLTVTRTAARFGEIQASIRTGPSPVMSRSEHDRCRPVVILPAVFFPIPVDSELSSRHPVRKAKGTFRKYRPILRPD